MTFYFSFLGVIDCHNEPPFLVRIDESRSHIGPQRKLKLSTSMDNFNFAAEVADPSTQDGLFIKSFSQAKFLRRKDVWGPILKAPTSLPKKSTSNGPTCDILNEIRPRARALFIDLIMFPCFKWSFVLNEVKLLSIPVSVSGTWPIHSRE